VSGAFLPGTVQYGTDSASSGYASDGLDTALPTAVFTPFDETGGVALDTVVKQSLPSTVDCGPCRRPLVSPDSHELAGLRAEVTRLGFGDEVH
jgi:hypothetical protein